MCIRDRYRTPSLVHHGVKGQVGSSIPTDNNPPCDCLLYTSRCVSETGIELPVWFTTVLKVRDRYRTPSLVHHGVKGQVGSSIPTDNNPPCDCLLYTSRCVSETGIELPVWFTTVLKVRLGVRYPLTTTRLATVSYTHLDVYQRQVSNSQSGSPRC
ncbi:hypothetical protein DEO72_LG2g4477 [Vigna unguiculata]|uniref:Uncharacterized protein n=1 Tax=Vigna unguiculata TaxID=3917 RepID=A0A4D6L6R3_VIGUN|nr:hypothetical protein DEO72_LG2g4475 [Vigna unguiculata]QCD84126.1 hypothetical protein DEO72_LG2g4476 [Vigna unguiculata]QCD84127.1 hypothetical protein DEO72_LG2g4477 [Vigna unguiculata]